MPTKSKSVFEVLSAINVNEHTNEKGGLTYLSWAFAWAELQKAYPESTYEFLPTHFYDNKTAEVTVEATVEGVTRQMKLPAMDFRNKAIVDPSSRDISDTRMRCLVKVIAMFGLGLYIYAGEDIPQAEKEAEAQVLAQVIVLLDANDIAFTKIWHECRRDEQGALWKKLNTKQQAVARELLEQVKAGDTKT